MSKHDDDLWDMSDDALDAAYKEAKAEENSPDTDIEQEAAAEELDTASTDVDEELEELDDSENEDANEDTNEEITDGSEQPEVLLEDSDHDASAESTEDDVEDDKTDKTEDANPDGDAEPDAEESPDDTDETKDEEQPTRSYSFKANGKDFEFSSEEIVEQFPKIFGKAMDYTKKMQAIKPWRKTIDALEGAKISHDDVSLMIDVLKGDKEAINEVLKRTGTDTLELNAEDASEYEAKDYGRDESALAISDIVDEIGQDPEYATTNNIISKEWDDRSWATMSKNPEMIKLLHTDVKSGMYKTLQPIAEKMKVFDSGAKSDLDYYKLAADQHFKSIAQQQASQKTKDDKQAVDEQAAATAKQASEEKKARVAAAKVESTKRSESKKASVKRKAAAPTKSATANSVVDYLDESDESYDTWYKGIQDSM